MYNCHASKHLST